MSDKILGTLTREELVEKLQQLLPQKRLEHVLRVEDMAIRLSNFHNADIIKCRTAALYHDFAKAFSLEKSLMILQKYDWEYDEQESRSGNLIHSKVAAAIAKNEYRVDDEETLLAISYHTTGRADMSLIEKIIFVADAIEEGRDYPGVSELREKAFGHLNFVMLDILNSSILYLIKKEEEIHINTVLARNNLLR